MLVDLARNDIGRVCKFGSVDVTEFMGIEKFSHVQHIVSTVNGSSGTISTATMHSNPVSRRNGLGRPKIRAMQIIDERGGRPGALCRRCRVHGV